MKAIVPFLAAAPAHNPAAWDFSRGHVIGAVVTLVVLIVAGWIAWRQLNRPTSNMPSRREHAEFRRWQDAHWDRVYRGGPQ